MLDIWFPTVWGRGWHSSTEPGPHLNILNCHLLLTRQWLSVLHRFLYPSGQGDGQEATAADQGDNCSLWKLLDLIDPAIPHTHAFPDLKLLWRRRWGGRREGERDRHRGRKTQRQRETETETETERQRGKQHI